MNKRSALIEQQPIVITPCMVEIYGPGEAIFLQQLWYWQRNSQHIFNEKRWVYNTQKEWARQTGIPAETLRRMVKRLEDRGAIDRGNFNKSKMDKTTWYHLNVDIIRQETAECLEKYDSADQPLDAVRSTASDAVRSTAPIPETTTKTTTNYPTDNSSAKNSPSISFDAKNAETEKQYAGVVKDTTPKASTLIWQVAKMYGLPVMNANHMRSWGKQLDTMDDGVEYLQMLLDNDLRITEGEFRPTLNTAFDIVNKKVMIQRFYEQSNGSTLDPRSFKKYDKN